MLERIKQTLFLYVVDEWQIQEAGLWIWLFIALQS